jgi:hypothetical protein
MDWRKELLLERLRSPPPDAPPPVEVPLLPDTMEVGVDTAFRADTAATPDTSSPTDTAVTPDTMINPDTAAAADPLPGDAVTVDTTVHGKRRPGRVPKRFPGAEP